MELVDCHTHTVYSDGTSTLEQNVQAAIRRNATTIACTDHLAHPAFMDCAIDERRIDGLSAETARCRELYPGIDIVFGFEADWYEGCEANIRAARKNATFLLGSVHYLGEYAIDWSQDMRIWNEIGADEVWRRYVESWCKACFCPIGFDSMAHPDLVRIFERDGYAPRNDIAPLWDDMAEAAREAGVRIEVSSAGLRKRIRDFYPSFELLRRFRDAAVPITVGSDAHRECDVAAGIEEACAYARKAGYKSVEVPTSDGDWRRILL